MSVEATVADTTVESGQQVELSVEFINSGPPTEDYVYRLRPTVGFEDLFELRGCGIPGAPGLALDCAVDPSTDRLEVVADQLPTGSFTVDVDLGVKEGVAAGAYPVDQIFRSLETGVRMTPALTVTVEDPPPAEADLSVALDATAGPLLGSQITYGLSAANNGPGDVESGSLVVSLPTQVTSVRSLSGDCTYSSSAGTVTCATGAVAHGSTFTTTFRADLGLLSLGSLPASAVRAASSPHDPDADNDSASAECRALTSALITCS